MKETFDSYTEKMQHRLWLAYFEPCTHCIAVSVGLIQFHRYVLLRIRRLKQGTLLSSACRQLGKSPGKIPKQVHTSALIFFQASLVKSLLSYSGCLGIQDSMTRSTATFVFSSMSARWRLRSIEACEGSSLHFGCVLTHFTAVDGCALSSIWIVP